MDIFSILSCYCVAIVKDEIKLRQGFTWTSVFVHGCVEVAFILCAVKGIAVRSYA